MHSTDVDSVKLVKKQKFPVLPTVEEPMNIKIDRILQFCVVDESQSVSLYK